jgi:hypothetical protein
MRDLTYWLREVTSCHSLTIQLSWTPAKDVQDEAHDGCKKSQYSH